MVLNIKLSPINMLAEPYTLARDGMNIIINGVAYSLEELKLKTENQEVLPEFIVYATEDTICLLLPYWGPASTAVTFPELIVDPPDGPIVLPS